MPMSKELALKAIKDNAEVSYSVGKAYLGHPDQKARHHLLSCNHIARTVAYRLNELDDNDILVDDFERLIDVIDEDGAIRQYNAKKISLSDRGLVCYILIPARFTRADNNARVHLVFRGTKDSHAWKRNVQDLTPGSRAIEINKDVILDELRGAITLEKSHIIISGHSLGGADAQNLFSILMHEITGAKDTHNDPLLNISELTLNASNPAGVHELVAHDAKRDSNYLSANGLKISAMYILAAGDIVPQSGHAHILADSSIIHASVYLAKFSDMFSEHYLSGKNLGLAGFVGGISGFITPFSGVGLIGLGAFSTFLSHKAKISIEELLEGKFELYSNFTDDGKDIISEKLGKHVLDNYVVVRVQGMFNSFMEPSSGSGERSNTSSPTCLSAPSPALEEDWVFVPNTQTQKQKLD